MKSIKVNKKPMGQRRNQKEINKYLEANWNKAITFKKVYWRQQN